MIYESRAIAHENESVELDPFAFWPDLKSRLVGLGGTQAGDDPDYALHTLYVSCGTGPIVFALQLTDLRAERGTLILRVHELPEVMGAHARQIAISQTQLAELIRTGGRVSLPAMARLGSHYALLGHIYGDTPAAATSVSVEVARRTPDPRDPTTPTQFRADSTRVGTAPRVIGQREGTLVTPVSQLCTERQLREPIFEAILRQMGGLPDEAPIERWEHAYIGRVLDRYDAARSGARGLGIGALWPAGRTDPIANWLIEHGCLLTLTSPEEPQTELIPSEAIRVRWLDPNAIEGLAGFDFAWATRRGGVGSSDRHAVLRFIEDSLRALKPGGLMVLVVSIDVAPHPIGDEAGPLLRRPDIDRMAMLLLSRGHQVALICPWGNAIANTEEGGDLMVSAFGLVIRRAA